MASGPSGGPTIGTGKIDIYADIKSFDTAMAALPKKASDKMGAVVKALEAKAAQAKLDLKNAWNTGTLQDVRRVTAVQDALQKKIEAVTNAAIKQAQALQAAARATTPFISPQQAAASAAKVAATGQSMNSIWLDQQMAGKLGQIGEAGKKAGDQVRQGGSNGAMGLMVLSQTIDDAQYGLASVVNNMPQVGMAIGQALGVSTEKAMAFGGAMGIAAVAVNTWVKNGDHVKAIFGGSQSEDVKELTSQLTTLGDTARSLFATLANLDGGFNWVSATSKDTAALEKQMADKAAFATKAAERVASNRSAVAGIKESGADERGAGFTKAVEGYGGGDKLASDVANQRMGKAGLGGLKKEDRERREKLIREGVDSDIALAKEGDKGAAGRLGADSSRLAGFVKFNAPGAKEGRDKQAREDDASASKTAKSLEDTVGQKLLKEGDVNIWGDVMEAMKKAGYSAKEIAATLPAVATKLKADIEGKVKERAASEGIDPAEARKQLLAEAADKEKREMTPRKREDERLAGAMTGSVGQKYLAHPGMDDSGMQREVEEAMKKAGMSAKDIADAVAGTAKKLRENLDKAVKDRALDRGIAEGTARQQLLKEAQAKDDKQTNRPQGEFTSGADAIFQKMQLAATANDVRRAQGDDKERIPAEQLKAQQDANTKLDAIKSAIDNKEEPVARFGGRRGGR